MRAHARGGRFVRLFGSAVAMQALLSATSLLVGLIFIRRTSDLQYGYFVLMGNVVLLAGTLQGSFIQPQLVLRMSKADASGRANLIGGLLRDQRRLWPLIPCLAFACALPLWLLGRLPPGTFLVVMGGAAAVMGALFREFFRMVLLSHRRPTDVLRSDTIYVLLLVTGAVIATFTPAPAAIAGVLTALAAFVGGSVCARALSRFEAWNPRGAPGILRTISRLGTWSAIGAGVHWMISQGYNFLVAGMLSVHAVAAIAATRLAIMPINLLSSGVGTVMLPTTAAWLNSHSASHVLGRLLRFALILSVAALCYFAVLWPLRDWIFTQLLKKQIPQRDSLMLLWFALALVMLWRDQLIYLLTIRQRFRLLTSVSIANAAVSLSITYVSISHFGIIGVLLGLLAGELLNVGGLLVLSRLETLNMLEQAAS